MPELTQLEYLADLVISLDYRDTTSPEKKPIRLLKLHKSRHQISRPGAHVLHISGSKGIRIAPQLPSHLDLRSLFKIVLPHNSRYIDSLRYRFLEKDVIAEGDEVKKNAIRADEMDPTALKIFTGSHILIHGKGSGGKAGFALKVLTAPIFEDNSRLFTAQRNILIVSFLYPKEYYETLIHKLLTLRTKEYSVHSLSRSRSIDYDVLAFYPGYLNAEDMASKIMGKLDGAELSGNPFDGVLIDGLHNVFMQFPKIEENPMVWPMLFSHFRRRDLTVVTTNTDLRVGEATEVLDHTELFPRKWLPLSHALVSAADFVFELKEDIEQKSEKGPDPKEPVQGIAYKLITALAIRQMKPERHLLWHREKLVIYEAESEQRKLDSADHRSR